MLVTIIDLGDTIKFFWHVLYSMEEMGAGEG